MTKSMTGFGRADLSLEQKSLSLELRSVNSRYFEFQLRAPRILQSFESTWRQAIQQKIKRGKLELRVKAQDNSEASQKVKVDTATAKAYKAAWQELADSLEEPLPNLLTLIPHQAEIFQLEEENEDETWKELVEKGIQLCLEDFDAMREREGAALRADMLERLECLKELREKLAKKAPLVPEYYRERLLARVQELLGEKVEEFYDGQRVAAEVAIFADKADVQEELVRLESHFDQFASYLDEEGPIGKKCDFLIQEMNRECNTVGSKCNDLEMTKLVLEMKSQVEQLREQIQNLE